MYALKDEEFFNVLNHLRYSSGLLPYEPNKKINYNHEEPISIMLNFQEMLSRIDEASDYRYENIENTKQKNKLWQKSKKKQQENIVKGYIPK